MHQDAGAGENCVGSYLRLPAAIADLAGRYTGEWKSSGAAIGGSFRLSQWS